MKRTVLVSVAISAVAHAFAAETAPTTTAGATLPATLPVRRDAEVRSGAPDWAPSLALAIAAGLGGAWAWRRRSSRGRGPVARAEPLVRLANLSLTPQASVHAVQWRGEEWLLACTPQQVTLLSRRTIGDQEEK